MSVTCVYTHTCIYIFVHICIHKYIQVYCGICHTDLHTAAGHLGGIGMKKYPCVPVCMCVYDVCVCMCVYMIRLTVQSYV